MDFRDVPGAELIDAPSPWLRSRVVGGDELRENIMNIEELTIGQARQLAAMFPSTQQPASAALALGGKGQS